MKTGLITFTILELAALLGWMARFDSAPYSIAIIILVVGLFLEHIVALNDFRGATSLKRLFSIRNLPLLKLAFASISEAVVWILWLLVASGSPVTGAVILLVGIYLQHNAEINIFIGAPTFSKLLSGRVLGFTITEVISGVGWLVLIGIGQPVFGAVFLAFGLLSEHMGQGDALRKAKNA